MKNPCLLLSADDIHTVDVRTSMVALLAARREVILVFEGLNEISEENLPLSEKGVEWNTDARDGVAPGALVVL